jgi:hypothetical protein
MFSARLSALSLVFVASLSALSTISYSASAQTVPGSPSNEFQAPGQPVVSGPHTLTSQQQALVNNATAQQIAQAEAAMAPIVANLKGQISSHQSSTGPSWQSVIEDSAAPTSGQTAIINTPLMFSTANGSTSVEPKLTFLSNNSADPGWNSSSTAAVRPAINTPGHCSTCIDPIPGPPVTLPTDTDQDGIWDTTEQGIGDEFTPLYGISQGEQNQFAKFENQVPLTIASLVGTNPPYSYYAVSPLGLATDSKGNQLYAVRIDYLTLWNADDGLVGGGAACGYSYVGLDTVIRQLTGHTFDAERSAMLIAAPAVNGGMNEDASAYSIYAIYTAAHEGTFFDQSMYIIPSSPVPPNNHLNLALSLSKHSTYAFNPDFYPMTPSWFIEAYFASVDAAFAAGEIDDLTYALFITAGNDTFFGCVVERWGNQGGAYAILPTPRRVIHS